MVTVGVNGFSIETELCISPKQFVFMFHKILPMNIDSFPKWHNLLGLSVSIEVVLIGNRDFR
jgi:hypothetical protein